MVLPIDLCIRRGKYLPTADTYLRRGGYDPPASANNFPQLNNVVKTKNRLIRRMASGFWPDAMCRLSVWKAILGIADR